jgi:hypothetical protein
MPQGKAALTVTAGSSQGDTLSLELGYCRLIGRHLSESETALIDRDGNRILDGNAGDIIVDHLQERAPSNTAQAPNFSPSTFERGPDMIFQDNSISRAHAMIFYDAEGFGIIDLASTNGVELNGSAVTSALVKDGDAITLGKTTLQVVITG